MIVSVINIKIFLVCELAVGFCNRADKIRDTYMTFEPFVYYLKSCIGSVK